MRLLHTTNFHFEEFWDDRIPDYATLSHCWGQGEVSLQTFCAEVKRCNDAAKFRVYYSEKQHSQPGYWKIVCCCQLANQNGFTWVWIDTCCIDKSSSAELSEAINSMYRIYEEAGVCYAYLADVKSVPASASDKPKSYLPTQPPPNLVHSRWFTRGWTLQELLAPSKLLFYSSTWELIGSRESLSLQISNATKISSIYLNHVRNLAVDVGSETQPKPGKLPAGGTTSAHFGTASIATRMSWLSHRHTSRIEDMAYCMLGIFDVNMPLLYGEGRKAFMRMQLEIIKKSNDESIFAWIEQALSPSPAGSVTFKEGIPLGMLADWPDKFADSGDIWIDREEKISAERPPYSMTNRGLEFKTYMTYWSNSSDALEGTTVDVGLNCFRGSFQSPNSINITLRCKGKYWVRVEQDSLKEKRWLESNVRRLGSMPWDASATMVTLFIKQLGL